MASTQKHDIALAKFHEDFLAANAGKGRTFEIVRKEPSVMLAMRRIVYDNDHQAQDLKQAGFPQRWAPAKEDSGWSANAANGFAHSGQGDAASWLRYSHLLRPDEWPTNAGFLKSDNNQEQIDALIARVKPQLITDFSSYNEFKIGDGLSGTWRINPQNWVGDLMLECELKVEEAKGEFWMELSQGADRFQARWNLASGECTLFRLTKGKDDPGPIELAKAQTNVNRAGTYQLRFANFDQRLTVWVDRQLPFEDGKTYDTAWEFDPITNRLQNAGPTRNDLEPASLASKGAAVQVHHIKLWRDTYYCSETNEKTPDIYNDAGLTKTSFQNPRFWSTPEEWEPLRSPKVISMYVHPGHYLCFGDNSAASYDGRSWGLVPQRLLLGRALAVYYPFSRASLIY
jgi:signal peptidase I